MQNTIKKNDSRSSKMAYNAHFSPKQETPQSCSSQ